MERVTALKWVFAGHLCKKTGQQVEHESYYLVTIHGKKEERKTARKVVPDMRRVAELK